MEEKPQFKSQSEKLSEWFNQNCKRHRGISKSMKKYNIKKHNENLILFQKGSKQYKKKPQ